MSSRTNKKQTALDYRGRYSVCKLILIEKRIAIIGVENILSTYTESFTDLQQIRGHVIRKNIRFVLILCVRRTYRSWRGTNLQRVHPIQIN